MTSISSSGQARCLLPRPIPFFAFFGPESMLILVLEVPQKPSSAIPSWIYCFSGFFVDFSYVLVSLAVLGAATADFRLRCSLPEISFNGQAVLDEAVLRSISAMAPTIASA